LLQLILALSNNATTILYEPSPPSCILSLQSFYKSILKSIEIFSPNWEEACGILGVPPTKEITSIATVCSKLRQLGAQIVVLRIGKHGSVVYLMNNLIIHIPAFSVEQVKDVTGAGNTYTGAFVTGWVHYKPYPLSAFRNRPYHRPLFAGVLATISASFTVEEIGPAKVLGNEAARFIRMEKLWRHCEHNYESIGLTYLSEENAEDIKDENIVVPPL
jgi:sugar/nucleoside kinase (ribokinase family)